MAKRPDRCVLRTAVLAVLFATLARSPILHAQADSLARRVFDLTNQDRQQKGLPLLRWNDALAAAAQGHAQWMLRQPSLSHQYPGEPDLMTRAAHAGAHFRAIAENIAIGPTPDSLENQWMHSTPHRTNILDPKMNALGVAVIRRGPNLYAVEDFSQANEALTRAQVEERVRALLHAEGLNATAPAVPAETACAAEKGMPAGARSIVRFQTPDLSQLPGQVALAVRTGDFRNAAVGACAPTSSQAAFYHLSRGHRLLLAGFFFQSGFSSCHPERCVLGPRRAEQAGWASTARDLLLVHR